MNVHVINDDTVVATTETMVTYHEAIANGDTVIFDPLLCIIFALVATIGAIRNIAHIHKMNKETLQLVEELNNITKGDDNDNT